MFIQYHDIIKPVYLYAIIKMITTGDSFGLPVHIIQNMSILSLVEWYINRRYKNPLRQLDWAKKADPSLLDSLMRSILQSDKSLYSLSPLLNMGRIFQVYRQQHMSFPIFIYSEEEEPFIKEDCKCYLSGIHHNYVWGDLKNAISKCDQNFTYIFSDIELMKKSADILKGTYSHILLARDYRYNYLDYYQKPKYDLQELMTQHPFIRIGTTTAVNLAEIGKGLENISSGGTE